MEYLTSDIIDITKSVERQTQLEDWNFYFPEKKVGGTEKN